MANKGTKRGTLHSTMKASMKATLGGTADMREAVRCPPNESLDEWLAVNTVHFFNAASMVYGTCCQYCDEQKCPVMSAGPKVEYLWMDGKAYKKPTKMPALQYIELMFTWVEEQISDPALFPVEDGAKFPSDLKKVVSNIFRRLVRLYGHIYYSHFDQAQEIGAEAHLNTCFKHLIYFIQCHELVEPKELEPVQRLIDKFTAEDSKQPRSVAAAQ